MNRRFFLRSGAVALAGVGVAGSGAAVPSFLRRAVMAAEGGKGGRRKTLVAIFQRGAVDGLNMVIPHGERSYYELRPSIAVAQPRAGAGDAGIDLDGFFALHPSLAPFKPLWDEKRLAVVHAVGSPDSTRSHFDAQDYMESGTPGRKSTPDGWLNRHLQARVSSDASPFRAVSVTQNLPRSLQGRAPALAIQNLAEFSIRAGRYSAGVQGGFEDIYEQSASEALRGTGRETFEAVNYLKRVNPAQYRPENGAQYPPTPFGRQMLQIAQLIKAGVGLEVAFTDMNGWDTHGNEGGARGQLANLLGQFSAAITAFTRDLGPARMEDVLVLTMSEFGRTVRENGTRGTDHGHANAMFLIGGGTRGGRVHGRWPGLRADQLHEGRDLALTTDFRDVFAEAAARHLGQTDLSRVFPNYPAGPSKFRGLLG
jgi:uncharacterized protein (DUF1501 family)